VFNAVISVDGPPDEVTNPKSSICWEDDIVPAGILLAPMS